MTEKTVPQSLGFNKNYKKLNDIVLKLRAQKEPDIDALLPMVEEATVAYKACKTRLDAVQSALREHLKGREDE